MVPPLALVQPFFHGPSHQPPSLKPARLFLVHSEPGDSTCGSSLHCGVSGAAPALRLQDPPKRASSAASLLLQLGASSSIHPGLGPATPLFLLFLIIRLSTPPLRLHLLSLRSFPRSLSTAQSGDPQQGAILPLRGHQSGVVTTWRGGGGTLLTSSAWSPGRGLTIVSAQDSPHSEGYTVRDVSSAEVEKAHLAQPGSPSLTQTIVVAPDHLSILTGPPSAHSLPHAARRTFLKCRCIASPLKPTHGFPLKIKSTLDLAKKPGVFHYPPSRHSFPSSRLSSLAFSFSDSLRLCASYIPLLPLLRS